VAEWVGTDLALLKTAEEDAVRASGQKRVELRRALKQRQLTQIVEG
jgi:hypothetical protein